MKKKIVRAVLLLFLVVSIVIGIINVYKWIVCGKQIIKISTSAEIYANSKLPIVTTVKDRKTKEILESKTKIRLLNSKGKKVKKAKVEYDEDSAIVNIPQVKEGKYFIETKVSSKSGKDTIKKEIYISDAISENATITLDKGIYKPGDDVNFRVLLTKKENDEPVKEDVNISIYDGNDNKVYNEDVSASDYGIVSGKFTLANEVNSGIYRIVTKTKKSETTKKFKVNPYITPKYDITLKCDKENYLVGDTAKIDINAKYFFGEPVENAKYSVYINDELYNTVNANSNGDATVEYKINDEKTYNIKVEAVDSSNYFVEKTSKFVAGKDLFKVELMPEYGELIPERKNKIYVFTKSIDGKPIKAYVNISVDKTTKQIATNEQGIGEVSLDISSSNSSDESYYKKSNKKYYYEDDHIDYKDYKKINVTAEDINKNKIEKDVILNVTHKNLLIATDKVKYNQGEDIKINITSDEGENKNIYILKNDKAIKIINTDSNNVTVNLDDVYGLIDICITDKPNNSIKCKKTIFIAPAKKLNIDINTDKKEYKPGDNISVSLNVSDEENSSVDAALLVSMLDNSVLSLADNDLSIDNIKMALGDINFSNELDAATLYSCLVNDSSEQTIMALLLKQADRNLKISESDSINFEEKDRAGIISIVALTCAVVGTCIYLSVKFPKFRKVLKHIINFLVLESIFVILLSDIIDEIFYAKDRVISMIILAVAGLGTYILFGAKCTEKTFRTSVSIIISIGIIIMLQIFFDGLGISLGKLGIIISVIFLLEIIIYKVFGRRKKNINKIINEIIYILKYALSVALSVALTWIISRVIDFYMYDTIAILIIIIATYILNYKFNIIGKKENVKKQPRDRDDIIFYTIIILAFIGVISIGFFVANSVERRDGYYNSWLSEKVPIDDSMSFLPETSSSSGRIPSPSDFSGTISDSGSARIRNSGIGNIFEKADSFISDNKSETVENAKTQTSDETSKVTDNKIRNVFLESMCFVPELVTSNGKADLNLTLSDNITTWTIQTVGNTKNGKIGYGMIDNVKVFKEFFADFELPKNLVETDKVNIPVTVYNYTDTDINTTLKIKEEEWFKLDNSNNIAVNIKPQSSSMTYVPITILKNGEYKFQIETTSGSLTDIVEKEISINPNGYKIEKVVSTGYLEKELSEDILILDDAVPNTGKAKIKIYASQMAQTIEGMEKIFKMPTGCFEQISSSLYPNIVALKYLEDNKMANDEIKKKALEYISAGYQKLLTYEVKGEEGGYSLYGNSPAETVLTAYGLMELTDLSKVYSVDENVINKMNEFLYKKQNPNGTFTITGSHIGGANYREKLALNAYITWALSESNPDNEKLSKSVEYLKKQLDNVDDNYTLALIANTLANVKDKTLNRVIKRLVDNIKIEGNNASITSEVKDYYGSSSCTQSIQTVALTSMALSKSKSNASTNKSLINYLVSQKDKFGNWYSTQATVLALKAINQFQETSELKKQTISVKVNSDEQKIEIADNPLELYELTFNNLNKENKLNINMEKGSAYYEVIEEYYMPYEKIDTSKDDIEISVSANNTLKVNEILTASIKLTNKGKNSIYNGMVTIDIPQGFSVLEESLGKLKAKGIIEKYETSYRTVNLYLRDFDLSQIIDLNVQFRAMYPVEVTGLSVRAYDYYNPEIEGKSMPIKINVNK